MCRSMIFDYRSRPVETDATEGLHGADILMTRHAETRLNVLIAGNEGYSRMEWEHCEGNKRLTSRGRTQASRLGRYLKRVDWIPDIALTSTAERTILTARIVAKELGIEQKDDWLLALGVMDETCCREYMANHIPDHTFGDFSSYESKVSEAEELLAVFWGQRVMGKKVLFVGHELRNTFLLDAALGRRTRMDVQSVCFPNCGIQFLKRARGRLLDVGGVCHLDEVIPKQC